MVLEMTYPQLERAVNPTHDIRLFSGRSNPKLAQEIADYREGLPPGQPQGRKTGGDRGSRA